MVSPVETLYKRQFTFYIKTSSADTVLTWHKFYAIVYTCIYVSILLDLYLHVHAISTDFSEARKNLLYTSVE